MKVRMLFVFSLVMSLLLLPGAATAQRTNVTAADCMAGTLYTGSLSSTPATSRCSNSQGPVTSGTAIIINNNLGGMTASFGYIYGGTLSTVSTVLKGCKIGVTSCDTINTSTATSNSIVEPTLATVYDYFTVTPTFTGGASPTLTVNTTVTIARSGSSSGGGTPSNSTPNMDSGSGSAGTATTYARGDHTHPVDTSRQAALGFTPENVSNKDSDGTLAANDNTHYPTDAAVRTYVAANSSAGPTLPSLSSLSWINQSTATATQVGTLGPISVTIPYTTSAGSWSFLVTAQPSTPYGFVTQARCAATNLDGGYQSCDLVFRDSGSGLLAGVEFLAGVSGQVARVLHFSSPTSESTVTTYGAASYGNSLTAYPAAMWVKLRNSGTTLYYDISLDGVNFINIYSEAVGAFITPNQIGFGGWSGTGNAADVGFVDILQWSTVSNATL